jgi:LmbE family N-acetylglucosaminyl deacetylase
MRGSPDNQNPASLYQADLEDVARDTVHVIRQVRPHVIITHEPTGGYQHPDHVKVSRAVAHAWAAASDATAYPTPVVEGRTPWQPARLYYLVVPRSAIRWFTVLLLLTGRNPRRFGNNRDIDVTRLGVPDSDIHVRLDLRKYLPIREAASACHRSQGGGAHWPAFLGRHAMSSECLVQALPPGARRHSDLFAGLEATA